MSQSVVFVDADGVDLDLAAPWGTGKSWTRTVTGLAVDGRGILVTGWMLHGWQHIRVQKQGTSAKAVGRAVLVDADCGLALVTVDDPAFWIGLPAAELTDAIARPGQARVLHATDGARVDVSGAAVTSLRQSGRCDLLALKLGQVDVRHVSQSDVVVGGSQVVGMVGTTANEEVFAFTSGVLSDFVKEARRPTYRGYPVLGTPWQTLTNPTLREELGLAPTDGGVRVMAVHPLGSAGGVLQTGDVILSIAGKKVDADGSYEHPRAGRGPFTAIFANGHHPGDVMEFGILRAGIRKTVSLTLKAWPGSTDLVPWFIPPEQKTTYAVEGGLVFENLSGEYLQTFGKDWTMRAPRPLLDAYLLDHYAPTQERSRVVVLTRVLADPATLGYQQLRDLVVESINGVRLRTLDDVHQAFAKPSGAFHVVTFAPGQHLTRMVLDVTEATAANERLRATYELPKGPTE